MNGTRICFLQDCEETAKTHGLCPAHHALTYPARKPKRFTPRQPLDEAFESRVQRKLAGECWPWSGSHAATGYATLTRKRDGKCLTILGHRLAYELFVGPIALGLVIDHLCRNRGCVNPGHLEAVTNEENIARGQWAPVLAAKATECKAGHPYTDENTYLSEEGHRKCRECVRTYQRNRYHERKAS